MSINFCGRCTKEISSDRRLFGTTVCECGWFDQSVLRLANLDREKKTIISMVTGTIISVFIFGFFSCWGGYGFKLPFVKTLQFVGMLSTPSYLELAKVCTEIGRFDCAKNAYTEVSTRNGDKSGFALRAKLEERLGEKSGALQSYAKFFKSGGKDAAASAAYGSLLEGANRSAEAMKAYELAIENSGDRLPILATVGLVRLLMKQGKYEDALETIEDFHKSAGNAVGYLNTELAQLKKHRSAQARSVARARAKRT